MLSQGPYNNIPLEDYLLLLKGYNGPNFAFSLILKGISSYDQEKNRKLIPDSENFMELLNTIQKHNIKSFNEASKSKEAYKSETQRRLKIKLLNKNQMSNALNVQDRTMQTNVKTNPQKT